MVGGSIGLSAAIGGFLLLAIIIYGVMRNRARTRSDVNRTEQATHDLYARTDAQDKVSDPDPKSF